MGSVPLLSLWDRVFFFFPRTPPCYYEQIIPMTFIITYLHIVNPTTDHLCFINEFFTIDKNKISKFYCLRRQNLILWSSTWVLGSKIKESLHCYPPLFIPIDGIRKKTDSNSCVRVYRTRVICFSQTTFKEQRSYKFRTPYYQRLNVVNEHKIEVILPG